jgi:hypothetical protein
MDLSHRQQQQLVALDNELRADPQLAGLLGTFSRLTAADPMPSHEQLPGDAPRTRWPRAAARAAAWLTRTARRWPSRAGRRQRPAPGRDEPSLATATLVGACSLAAWAPAGPFSAKRTDARSRETE